MFLEKIKHACNITAKSECGRFPLYSFIKTQVLLYFSRINCHEKNSLVNKAFKVNKSMSETWITWYTFAKHFLKEFDIDEEEHGDCVNLVNLQRVHLTFKHIVKEKYH